jgi:hypothetical protein
MTERKRILFKKDGRVVMEETRDLYLNQIDGLKWMLAEELECTYDDIDVEVEVTHSKEELSDYDVTSTGMVHWKDPEFKEITGVKVMGNIDELLDSISKKHFDKYLELS